MVVRLTDATLLSLSRNPEARKKLPVLNSLMSVKRRGCGKCGRRNNVSRQLVAVRNAVVASPSTLKIIKQLLRATRLIVYVKTGSGTKRVEV